jgi:membrane protein YqaA with SNARE-associated domain
MEQKTALETQVEEAAVQAGGLLRSRFGLWAIAGISFVESALLVPIITDPFMVAYILANRARAVRGVVVTTASSLAGGLFAYAFAFLFYEYIAAQYLNGSLQNEFDVIVTGFQEGVFWVTLAGAVTPIPYTLVAFGAGFTEASVLLFLLASLIGRGGRYALVGYLTYHFGERALAIARRNLIFASVVILVLALIYFFVLH